MFGNKKCPNCDRKVNKDFDFCPYCAVRLKDSKDYGLLGKSDNINDLDPQIRMGFQNMGSGSFMEKMIGGAIKMLEKEIQKAAKQEQSIDKEMNDLNHSNLKTNFQLYINGKKVNLPSNINGIQMGEVNQPKVPKIKSPRKASLPKVSNELLEKSARLPRKEPKTHLTRTTNKVIYELETPGLNKIENILVTPLENSFDIKAYTEKTVFHKTLPVKLQLLQYGIKEGKLFLEFKA